MRTERKFQLARIWSNKQLSKIAHLFSGDIVNVSAWKDEDKQGRHYKDYFVNAGGYYYTNYKGFRGQQGREGEYFVDLAGAVPEELIDKFDAALSHTTLEHIFDVAKAFKNICSLSRDVVIIVVPFAQTHHRTEEWGDYWRFTPDSLRQLFKMNGMDIVYMTFNDNDNCGIYLFAVGSKHPDMWENKMPVEKQSQPVGQSIGRNKLRYFVKKLLGKN